MTQMTLADALIAGNHDVINDYLKKNVLARTPVFCAVCGSEDMNREHGCCASCGHVAEHSGVPTHG